jgi:hypothetical protein
MTGNSGSTTRFGGEAAGAQEAHSHYGSGPNLDKGFVSQARIHCLRNWAEVRRNASSSREPRNEMRNATSGNNAFQHCDPYQEFKNLPCPPDVFVFYPIAS